MEIRIVKTPVSKKDLTTIAEAQFGDFVKAVVDVKQEIMAIGGELHADEEAALMAEKGSERADTWGINIYPEKSVNEWVEFDSMVNLKPLSGNRSRSVEDSQIREKIKTIVAKLVPD